MTKKRFQIFKTKEGLRILKKNGSIQLVENPKAKKKETIFLVQRGNFTGWTPVKSSTWKVVKGISRGRTAENAIKNVLKKGYKRVAFTS